MSLDIPLTPEAMNEYLKTMPFAYENGLRVVEMGDKRAVCKWIHREDQLRPGGYIPGPTQFHLADLCFWFAVFTAIGVEPMSVTMDLSITFLRPAVGGDLMAETKIESVGRSRIYGETSMWVAGTPEKIVSRAVGSYSNPTGKRSP